MIDASGRKATSELAINAQIFYAMAVAPRYGKALDFLFIIFLRLDCFFFFLNDTPPTEISPLSLHDALPICPPSPPRSTAGPPDRPASGAPVPSSAPVPPSSSEPTDWLDQRASQLDRSEPRSRVARAGSEDRKSVG